MIEVDLDWREPVQLRLPFPDPPGPTREEQLMQLFEEHREAIVRVLCAENPVLREMNYWARKVLIDDLRSGDVSDERRGGTLWEPVLYRKTSWWSAIRRLFDRFRSAWPRSRST